MRLPAVLPILGFTLSLPLFAQSPPGEKITNGVSDSSIPASRSSSTTALAARR